jgi:hypothetical protein
MRNLPARASTPIAASGKNHHSRPDKPLSGSDNDCGEAAIVGGV